MGSNILVSATDLWLFSLIPWVLRLAFFFMVLDFWVLLRTVVESEGGSVWEDFFLISVLVSFSPLSERTSNLLDTVRAHCSMVGLNFLLSLGFVDLWAKFLNVAWFFQVL